MLDSLRRGGGEVVEVSLAEVAADYAASPLVVDPEKVEAPRIPAAATAAGGRIGGGQPAGARVDRNPAGHMLIRRGMLPDGRIADLRVGERIAEIADRLEPLDSEQVVDADAGAVLPGLHDHHLHLRAMAAALDSLTVGPPQVRTKAQLAQALRTAEPGPDGWIRAVGYHASVAGELDRDQLDALVGDIPVRVQHRSGAMWILNSAALAAVGLTDHPDGRLHSADDWADALPRRVTALVEITARLAGYGVTGITDATPDLTADDVASLSVAHRRGEIPQRLHFLAPGKRILHDDRLDVDELIEWVGDQPRR